MTPKYPLISIIVPIYNSESYLSECLRSIAAQTYKNIEVLLINDGSTDKSKQIAENICNIDNRFKLLSQPNSGVASARQLGLDNASGEYIIHCDSDDLMTEKAVEYLYNSIYENKSNISIGAYVEQSDKSNKIIVENENNKKQFLLNIITGKYRGSLWNKLISKDLYVNLCFDKDINYMEDLLILVKILNKDKVKISTIDDVVYFYRKVDISYTNNISHKSILDSIYVTEKICKIASLFFDKKVTSYVKNKLRAFILLNSKKSTRTIFPNSKLAFLKDEQLALKHKLIIILDFLYLNRVIEIYKHISKAP